MFLNSQNPKKFRFKMRRPKPAKKAARWVPLIPMLIGAIFVTVGLLFIHSNQKFAKTSVEAELNVILVERKQSDDGYVYRPTFQALSPSGESVEHTAGLWMRPKPHDEGDRVAGRANWETGELRSVGMMKSGGFLGTILTGVGGIAMLIGVVAMTIVNRKRVQFY